MLVYGGKANACKIASIVCDKCGPISEHIEDEAERRIANTIEKAMCQMARANCKKYRRKKNEYRRKRMFKKK